MTKPCSRREHNDPFPDISITYSYSLLDNPNMISYDTPFFLGLGLGFTKV